MDKNTSFNVGIYTRISVEEKVKSLADSIANQKIILSEYAINKGFNITRIYEDEGESGGSYNRPEFKLMLEDIENDIINCVLVKDLSRLGREYIETGEYIEKYFRTFFSKYFFKQLNFFHLPNFFRFYYSNHNYNYRINYCYDSPNFHNKNLLLF